MDFNIQQFVKAKEAGNILRASTAEQKNIFLNKLADLLLANINEILAENSKDLASAQNLSPAMLKRLTLNEEIIKSMANGLGEIAKMSDPVGVIEEKWDMPNGMTVGKMRVPIGVILFIYESRPNVIIDAAGLCVKSGNCLIARGGKEAILSNNILLQYIQQALKESALPEMSVQQMEDRRHEALAEAVKLDKYIDLVVPRGREQLINYIKDNARVPVIAHERGVCHMYIDDEANIEMAIKLALNAKTSNPAVCNSLEKILVHSAIANKVMPNLLNELFKAGVEVRGCEKTCVYDKRCLAATNEDWDLEYLDLKIAIKIIDSFSEALEWIEIHSSHHTDAIITENQAKADDFLRRVNSASVMVNVSTRLTDGGEFGLGAELGISTASIHMRGPMGLKDLTVTKYIVLGSGQIRT